MRKRRQPPPIAALAASVALAACATSSPPPAADVGTPSIRAEELVGGWGFAVFYNPADRARIETAARQQCGKPFMIGRGPHGGIMMYAAGEAQPQEMVVKAGAGGKQYIGPTGEPGGAEDSEIVSYDGRVLLLRDLGADQSGRARFSVFVRCAPKA
ncbi:MAG TPA: hypothetical protein VEK73_17550 [Xanthobacteraceae bacterium]|nr:hypothetical protein [Xanthobacteraceae bacterium]